MCVTRWAIRLEITMGQIPSRSFIIKLCSDWMDPEAQKWESARLLFAFERLVVRIHLDPLFYGCQELKFCVGFFIGKYSI